MDALFVPLASATGASLDQIKLITCLLISYPLGSVFIRLPSSRPGLKHVFNIVITLFFLIPMLHLWTGFLQLLVSVLGTYLIAANVKGPSMPWIVFAFVMGHLTINHVIRAIHDLGYETFEITGPQMVLTMKLTTFAWNVWDGRRAVEDLDKWQKEKRVVEYPSWLEFLGYAFYFPGILVGPSLEYADYMTLINGTLFKSIERANEDGGRLIPKGRKRVAYRKMVAGLIYLGLYIVYGGSFNYGVAIQDWFARKSFLYRIAYYQFCGFFERSKYYAIWTLTEGASILTGLGFTGFSPSGASRWEGAANVKVWDIEFAPNFKVLLDSWNMKTNVWLRECVYKRVTPKGKKPGFRSSMITFATSAFWHGISGGYYVTFVFAGFVQTTGRLIRSNLRPLFLPATYMASRNAPPPPQTPLKRTYDLVGTFVCILVLNFLAAPFMLLTVRNSLKGWSILHWYGLWMVTGALVFFNAGGAKWLRKAQAARVKKAGGSVENRLANGLSNSPATPSGQTVPPVDFAVAKLE